MNSSTSMLFSGSSSEPVTQIVGQPDAASGMQTGVTSPSYEKELTLCEARGMTLEKSPLPPDGSSSPSVIGMESRGLNFLGKATLLGGDGVLLITLRTNEGCSAKNISSSSISRLVLRELLSGDEPGEGET